MDPNKLKVDTDYDNDAMLQQATNIWQMLDEMADKDPAAYRKFIDKQIQEGKKTMKPPEPHMCLMSMVLVCIRLVLKFC